MGKRARRVALHPARRALAQRIRRIVQLPSARRMPEHQHLLVPDPGPGRHRRLEARLQPLPPPLLAGLFTTSPLRCQLYPPMNGSHPLRTSSRGPASRVYEPGGERLTYAELAAIVSETTGTTVVYKNLTEDQYRSALVKAGLTDTAAKTVASYDSGIARGELDTQTGDLQTLIGRPLTPITEIIKEAHQRALTAR